MLISQSLSKWRLLQFHKKTADHLALLFQRGFNVGCVADGLCIGVTRPILKNKNKPKSSCSSYRPGTVSSVFAKILEILIVDRLKEKCIIPPLYFDFQSGLGCFHALRSLCNILRDTEASGSPLVLGAYNVMNTFGFLICSKAM